MRVLRRIAVKCRYDTTVLVSVATQLVSLRDVVAIVGEVPFSSLEWGERREKGGG